MPRVRLPAVLRDARRPRLPDLPDELRSALRETAKRATKIRSPRGAIRFLEDELARLLGVAIPLVVDRPMPFVGGRPAVARMAVAAGSSGAALVEEAYAAASVASGGAAAAPGLPAVIGSVVASTVFEVYAAASIRVHQLRRAGRPVDADLLTREVMSALGVKDRATGDLVRAIAARFAKRLARRLAFGLAPVVGAIYSGFDAQRTVKAMSRLPLPPVATERLDAVGIPADGGRSRVP